MVPNESQDSSRVLEDLIRLARLNVGEGEPCGVDEERLWTFLDGDLPPGEEDALFKHFVECGHCSQRLARMVAARREVAAEAGWSYERVAALIAGKLRSAESAGIQHPPPEEAAPSDRIIGTVVQIGDRILTFLTSAFERIEPAPALSLAVRGKPADEDAFVSGGRWIGQFEGIRLAMGFEPPASRAKAVTLTLAMAGGDVPPGSELELIAEPDTLLEAVSLDDLPARLDLPYGKAWINLVRADSRVKLLGWQITGSADGGVGH